MSFDLATVMDGLATASGVTNAFGYPVPQITPPCIVVGYPTKFVYDLTFHAYSTDGKIEATIPVWYVVGLVVDKAARDALGLVIMGAGSMKRALSTKETYGVDYTDAVDVNVEAVSIGGQDYIGLRFDVEVVG